MRYQDLDIYTGDNESCRNCGAVFKVGRVIHVNRTHNLVFCNSDSDGPNLCLQNYLFRMFWMEHPNESLTADPMVYRQRTDPKAVGGVAMTPTFWERIITFFGRGSRT